MAFLYALGGFVIGAIAGWTVCYFFGKSRKFASKTFEKASKQ